MASAGNLSKALRPIQPIAVEHLLASEIHMDLDAIAVVLDFVKPTVALRRSELQRRELGLNEPRHGWNTLGMLSANPTLAGINSDRSFKGPQRKQSNREDDRETSPGVCDW